MAFEDADYLPIVMLHVKSVYASDLVLYYYENNCKSITSDSSIDIQIKDKMEALRSLVEKFKDCNQVNFHLVIFKTKILSRNKKKEDHNNSYVYLFQVISLLFYLILITKSVEMLAFNSLILYRLML